MALTDTQKAQIRFYLGYSDVSQGGSPNRLEMAMGALTAGGQAIVDDLLVRLEAIRTRQADSTFLQSLGLKSVDNNGVVWQDGASSLQTATASLGRSLVSQLAVMFGVTVQRDVFGPAVATSGPMGLG